MIGPNPAIHPGEILREEFLAPLDMRPYALAKYCGIARSRLERVVCEEVAVTADTALRLGKVFGTGPEFWMNLQSAYDLAAADKDAIKDVRAYDMAS